MGGQPADRRPVNGEMRTSFAPDARPCEKIQPLWQNLKSFPFAVDARSLSATMKAAETGRGRKAASTQTVNVAR